MWPVRGSITMMPLRQSAMKARPSVSTQVRLAMNRSQIRDLKRTVRDGPAGASQQAQQAALALLSRSVMFGHGRLAVLRLKMAVDAGAQVPLEFWAHCSRAAATSQDRQLQGVYKEAVAHALLGLSSHQSKLAPDDLTTRLHLAMSVRSTLANC